MIARQSLRPVMVIAALLFLRAGSRASADEPTETQRREWERQAESIKHQGEAFYQQGRPVEALGAMRKVLDLARKLYPETKYPDGHPNLAVAVGDVGAMLRMTGALEDAQRHIEAMLAMQKKLYPESKFPDGHDDLAITYSNLGSLLDAMGAYERSVDALRHAVAMHRKLHPPPSDSESDAALIIYLNNLGSVYRAIGEYEKAVPIQEEALAIARRLYPVSKYPDGHAYLATVLSNMGYLLTWMGADAKALPYYEEALAMRRKLYPPEKYPAGHPQLANSLVSMGFLLDQLFQYDKALVYHEQALAMHRRLYPESKFPNGHYELNNALSNLASFHYLRGNYRLGLKYSQEALAMRRKLLPESRYPAGHPDLARALNNHGLLLRAVGDYDEARKCLEQALAMQRTFYPKSKYPAGHPDLANRLVNLALLSAADGKPRDALPDLEDGLTIYRDLAAREVAGSPESDALALGEAWRRARDSYLSVAAQVPGTEEKAYRAVWNSKAAVSRVLERRHAAARIAGSEQAPKLARLRDVRRQIEKLLQTNRLKPADRDKLLADLGDERDKLERELLAALPVLARWKTLDQLGPDDLKNILPAGASFVDVLRYTRTAYDPLKRGKAAESWEQHYVAFVLAADRPVERVELGKVAAIDAHITAWRTAIGDRADNPQLAAEVRAAIWDKIGAKLPAGVRTVYLSLDGDLARVPWPALPGTRPGTVLLEELTGGLAVVPHGPFLLEALRFPRKYPDGPDSLAAVAEVDYGSSPWPALTGTAVELKAIRARADGRAVVPMTGMVTPADVCKELPKARYAHLATHGFFAERELAEEKQTERERMKRWQFSAERTTQRLTAAKNPLAFTGLVLAKGEVLTGLSLVDLPLENLKLVTLSACETGLGEVTRGEGVQGLQRAFHLAGCPNVVASLWNVNDAATAALMAQFYHELWVNKREPLAALREAQLTIYRHPERIQALAGERGRPALEAAAKLGSAATSKPDEKPKTAPTKLWAAFVLSGAGK